MVQFETYVEDSEDIVCSDIADKFSEELNELFLATFDTGKEHCAYLYKDGVGLGSTSFGMGERGGIPRGVKFNTKAQVPNNVNWSVYIHTHPPGDLRASASDMHSFVKEVHDTLFDNSKADVIAHFILTNIDMQREKELVLFGFERKPHLSEEEVSSTMFTLDEAVERQNEIIRSGDIEAMNELLTDSINDVKHIADLCFQDIEV